MKKWGHDELQEDLAAHLRGSRDRVIWTNMQLGPSGSPRPDVYTVPKTYSRFTPIAYECKISVSDFRRDVTSGKWQSYLKFAAGVVFAVPAGLIKKEDVPPGCGLIVRHEEVWRTIKGPTLKAIDSLPHQAWMKLIIDGLERQTREPRPRVANEWLTQKEIRKKYGDKIGAALSDMDNAEIVLRAAQAKANKSREALEAEERERTDRARLRVESEIAEMRRSKREFCAMLGLPEDAGAYLIQRTTGELINRLQGDGEVQRLRRALEAAQHALVDALKPLPTLSLANPGEAEAA